MEPKNKKSVLVLIIILLLVFLPLAFYAVFLKLENARKEKIEEIENRENVDKDFFFNGKLYFYGSDNSLLGIYKCINQNGYCDYANETIDDEVLTIYNDNKIDKYSLINNRYAFLIDNATDNITNASITLFDVTTSSVIAAYESVKNYSIGIEDDLYIVKSTNGKWGIISLNSDYKINVKFEYDYIGLKNTKNNETNKLSNDYFVYKQNNSYGIMDAFGNIYAKNILRPIYDYNASNIITKQDKFYYLYDYSGNLLLNKIGYKYLSFTGIYINVVDNNNQFYIYDPNKDTKVSSNHLVNNDDLVSSVINGNKITLYINDKIVETKTLN